MSLADPHVYLADMTGDGLTDVVLASGGGVTYWPARADGGWGTATELSPAPAFSRNHDPNRLFLVDVDGDGCATWSMSTPCRSRSGEPPGPPSSPIR